MRRTRGLLGILVVAGLASAWAGQTDLRPGDMATVKSDKAAIREGGETKAWLTKGQRIKIFNVQGGFALVYYTVGGKSADGYMSVADLEAPPREERKSPTGEPTYHADDEVVVVGKAAKLMMGADVLGPLPAGTRLTVKKVNEKWLGVSAPIKGKETFGWVHSREVDYPPLSERGKPTPPPEEKGKSESKEKEKEKEKDKGAAEK